jgi:hypothetical protein
MDKATRLLAAPWDTYTPTWTTTGTAPALNNGTLVGAARLVGTTLFLRGQLTFGSSTTGGTGDFTFPLPFGCAGVTAQAQLIPLVVYDTGVARYEGHARVEAGGTTFVLHVLTGGSVTSTVPMTWGNGDSAAWNGVIEVQA